MFNNKIYHKIDALSGSVATLRAEGVKYNEIAEVASRAGRSLAQVIKLDGANVTLQIFEGARGVDTAARVRSLGETMKVPFSDDLLGRAFTGSGAPRDGGPAVTGEESPIGQPSVNPARRVMPHEMVRTNIPMIDLFNTLVKSQKLPIFARAGEPYNELLARIALQADSDVIVIGGMGLKYDEYLKFRETLDKSGALSKTVMYVHTAADPTVECMLVPDAALAVAEKFALKGKDVLVLLTDMTSFADALKEIAITMEQIPSNRGYPGDLYSQLASRYEKAVDFEGEGSITILAVTTMPGDDVTHPVPDNTGYITEGQFYLRNGRIEPFGSLSRLKQQVNKNTREDHRTIMDAMIKLYAQYKEALEKQSMGFRMSAWDLKLLKYGAALEKQSMGFRMSAWDLKLLKYGAAFEKNMMDLSVNIPLEEALNLGWKILADCFEKSEVGIPTKLADKYWPRTRPL